MHAGRIKAGYVSNGVPIATPTLIFSANDEAVVTTLSEEFGGCVDRCGLTGEHRVITDTSEVVLQLENPDSVEARMIILQRAGRPHKPDISIRGRIDGFESLGVFLYKTTGWSLVPEMQNIQEELATLRAKGAQLSIRLSLGEVLLPTAKYLRPFVEVLPQ
ncbi:hypothetical protein FPZ12_029515 [Amycolatopsis acidicola]|uniref:Uncharacterized protein n=1 Tax=Amycolatopsis acidicola TaxID=2596893 RepID=A0A5N0UTZ6_9PSEU|nr:hypothetical protein [Amycolatopsis acidicola]KAA9155536.1 hypothetical protein FPZ12_029515 [Amycolatopsis acidicola]